MDPLIYPLYTQPPSVAFVGMSPFSWTCYSPPLRARSTIYRYVARPLLIVSVPWVTLLRLPLYHVTLCPLICRPWPATRSLSSFGDFSCCGSLCVSLTLHHPPWVLRRLLESSGVFFSGRLIIPWGRGGSDPPLPGSRPCWSLLPPLLRHSGALKSTPPTPFPPLFSLVVVLVESPLA